MKQLNLILIVTMFLMISCGKNDGLAKNGCGKIIISSEEYTSADAGDLHINTLEIEGSCLHVNYSASGCSGSSWQLNLIDSGRVKFHIPSQRYLRFDFKNTEMCEAYITKDTSFDLSEVSAGIDEVYFNVIGFQDSIYYDSEL